MYMVGVVVIVVTSPVSKDQPTADRRTCREGTKGMMFLFDVSIANALSLNKGFVPSKTKTQFLDGYTATSSSTR